MRRLARMGADLVMGRFEAHVARSVSFVTEALGLAREQTLDLDEIDWEVLADRLVTAGFLLGNLVRILHDELDGLDDAEAMAAVTEIAGRRRRPLPVREMERSEYLVTVLAGAIFAVNRAIRFLKRWRRTDGKVAANLRSARSNLCVAIHLLDPSTVDFLRDELDPTVEACREIVRERRWGIGGPGSMSPVH
ncbi:MAG: hypothetical protein WD646_00195 [Actinomycetota bacterium]